MSTKKLSTEQVIEQFKGKHGDRYDYRLVRYLNARTKVCVLCKEHGEFYITPDNHKTGSGCAKCNPSGGRLTTAKVIEQFRYMHGCKYDYSRVNYTGSFAKVKVICKEHGEFETQPRKHKSGTGCAKCSYDVKGLQSITCTPHQFKEPRSIYFVNFHHLESGQRFSKVGVCCSDGIDKRYPSCTLLKDGLEITKSQVIETDNITALGLELYVLRKWKKVRLDTKHILKLCRGGTETFSATIMGEGRETLAQWMHHYSSSVTLKHKGETI